MAKFVLLMSLIVLLMVPVSTSAATADIQAYTHAVSEFFQVDVAQVRDAAAHLSRVDELPVLYISALKAGIDPVAEAKEREDGTPWLAILQRHGLGSDLFHVQVRGFVPSATYQPILDKFDDDNPSSWSTVPLTDRDLLNLANLKFITGLYGYSKYRVMALRDKGQSFLQIQSTVLNLAQGPQAAAKTGTSDF